MKKICGMRSRNKTTLKKKRGRLGRLGRLGRRGGTQRRFNRSYKLRGGNGYGSSILYNFLEFASNPLSWASFVSTLPGLSRAAMSLLHDTNRAFEFYTYCKQIDIDGLAGAGGEGGGGGGAGADAVTIERFNDLTMKLGQFLTTIINSAVISKLIGAGYAQVTGKNEEYRKILKEFSELHYKIGDSVAGTGAGASLPSTALNVGMITAWGDWYRYELNIHMTNLMSVVNKMIGMSVLPMKRGADVMIPIPSVVVGPTAANTMQIPSSTRADAVGAEVVDSLPDVPPLTFDDTKDQVDQYQWWLTNFRGDKKRQ